MKMAIGGQFWKGFTLASSLPHSSPSLHLHSLSGLRDGFMSDGRTDGRMMISGEGGGNTFTHTRREGRGQSEEQGRAVAAPIYPSRPNWFLMCGFLLPTERLTGDDGVERSRLTGEKMTIGCLLPSSRKHMCPARDLLRFPRDSQIRSKVAQTPLW